MDRRNFTGGILGGIGAILTSLVVKKTAYAEPVNIEKKPIDKDDPLEGKRIIQHLPLGSEKPLDIPPEYKRYIDEALETYKAKIIKEILDTPHPLNQYYIESSPNWGTSSNGIAKPWVSTWYDNYGSGYAAYYHDMPNFSIDYNDIAGT